MDKGMINRFKLNEDIKRFAQLANYDPQYGKRRMDEYTFFNNSMVEADADGDGVDDAAAGGGMGATEPAVAGGADPMGGGAAPTGGADPMAGGAAPAADATGGMGATDPAMGGADPMGGAPMGGADPMAGGAAATDPAMGGGATDPAAADAETTPPEDIGADVDNNMVPDGVGEDDEEENADSDELGPDDEVIDVDELTKAQDKNNDKLTGLSHKLSNLVKALDKFQTAIDNNDRKIDDLKHELERRNPTDLERMNLRSLASSPYNQNPRDYWDKKMMGDTNYEVRFDNAISTANEPKIYTINRADVEDFNEDEIEKSLDNKMKLEDFINF